MIFRFRVLGTSFQHLPVIYCIQNERWRVEHFFKNEANGFWDLLNGLTIIILNTTSGDGDRYFLGTGNSYGVKIDERERL